MLKDALNRIKTVADTLPDDDPDKLEMLNMEGDYTALMEWALQKRNEALILSKGTDELAKAYAERKKRYDARADSFKEICAVILKSAGETKYQGASGTVSIGKKAQGVIVTDESLIPDKYFTTVKKLDKKVLNDAVKSGEAIPGAMLDNGGEQVTIRVK